MTAQLQVDATEDRQHFGLHQRLAFELHVNPLDAHFEQGPRRDSRALGLLQGIRDLEQTEDEALDLFRLVSLEGDLCSL